MSYVFKKIWNILKEAYYKIYNYNIATGLILFLTSAYGDKQGPDFDDMSSFFPCILCDARKYIHPGDELLVTEM
jgi:hypothetical protein